MATTTDTFRIADTVTCREEGPDGALLYEPDTDRTKVINYTALRIFKLCDGAHTIPDIVRALGNEFDEVPADAETHVRDLLAQLIEFGFVTKEAKTP